MAASEDWEKNISARERLWMIEQSLMANSVKELKGLKSLLAEQQEIPYEHPDDPARSDSQSLSE